LNFSQTPIDGLFIIKPFLHEDSRGVFHRSFCQDELEGIGIHFEAKQGNISINPYKHTLRGFHYQVQPTKESKILHCITGAIYNVVLDLRKDSKSYKKWQTIEISSENKIGLHVPHGCANAFLTLREDSIVHYYMGDSFNPKTYRGIRFNDPAFDFKWPFAPAVISEKDLEFTNFIDE